MFNVLPRKTKRIMKLALNILFQISLGIIILLVYCEFVVFYFVQIKCSWPKLNATQSWGKYSEIHEPVKIMVIADTHLLGSRKGHWFDKLRREWQMHRAFQTALSLHNPELVFVLGDVLDEGHFCSEEEFQRYIDRFYSLFYVPNTTKMYVVVGNHDIGFHYSVYPFLKERFEKGFNSPPVQLITVRNNHFVLVSSMALEGDGCFLCEPAERELARIEGALLCAQNLKNDCERTMNYSRPILMQHYPLYRKSDVDCTDFDAAPFPEREVEFRETWECLSKSATYQLLKQLQPRLVLSGHTHHGCTRKLPIGNGVEITIPSFSWRNKDNPNYGLGVFTPNNYAFEKCEMPKESSVIMLYILGMFGLLIWICISYLYRYKKYEKYKL